MSSDSLPHADRMPRNIASATSCDSKHARTRPPSAAACAINTSRTRCPSPQPVHRCRHEAVRVYAAAVLLVVLLQEPHQGALAEVCFGHNLQPWRLVDSQLQHTQVSSDDQGHGLQNMQLCWLWWALQASRRAAQSRTTKLHMQTCRTPARRPNGIIHRCEDCPSTDWHCMAHHLIIFIQNFKEIGRLWLLPRLSCVYQTITGPTAMK